MIQPIIDYIATYITLATEEISAINEIITIKKFKKGTLLLKEGEISRHAYFNIKG